MSTSPQLFFFCALHCEAKPVISHYRLKKSSDKHPFAIYRHDEVILTITGVSKNNMAAAVAYTLALFPASSPVLLNLGIAGHQTQALGRLFLADKITDTTQPDNVFYPQWVGLPITEFLPLHTVPGPSEQYPDTALCDMEASAFYQIAVKFSSVELIHCIKVISDNAEHSSFEMNAQNVSDWIADNIECIVAIAVRLCALKQHALSPTHPQRAEILARYHFSVTSKARLDQLLQRWQHLNGHSPIPLEQIPAKNGKQFLRWLEQQSQPFRL